MRKFVFIWLFCLPFVSSFAEQTSVYATKTSAIASAKKAAPGILSGRQQTESGAEITSTASTIVSAFVKRAESRQTRDRQPGSSLFTGQEALTAGLCDAACTSGIIKRSQMRPPLHLRLLFPEHYFW